MKVLIEMDVVGETPKGGKVLPSRTIKALSEHIEANCSFGGCGEKKFTFDTFQIRKFTIKEGGKV